MEKRKLGKTDVMVTPLAFGAWAIGGWMWGGADRTDAIKALKTSVGNGITTIDTAPVYGFGLSEELVGEAIRDQRNDVQILTKYGLRWDKPEGQYHFPTKDNQGNPVSIYKHASAERVVEECEQSLKRLKTDYIDLYQIHWPDQTTPIEETMTAVNKLLQQGKIRAAGVSNYSVAEMQEAVKYIPLASNQVPYSMVRRDIEEDIVPYCLENGISIIPYSPLQRGLLTGKIQPEYRFNNGDSRPDTPYFKIGNLIRTNEFLEQIKPIADSKRVSLAQLVLRWTLQRPGITCVLAGARNASQAAENAGALRFALTQEDMNTINTELDKLQLELD